MWKSTSSSLLEVKIHFVEVLWWWWRVEVEFYTPESCNSDLYQLPFHTCLFWFFWVSDFESRIRSSADLLNMLSLSAWIAVTLNILFPWDYGKKDFKTPTKHLIHVIFSQWSLDEGPCHASLNCYYSGDLWGLALQFADVGWQWENEPVESRQLNARTASERADENDEKVKEKVRKEWFLLINTLHTRQQINTGILE